MAQTRLGILFANYRRYDFQARHPFHRLRRTRPCGLWKSDPPEMTARASLRRLIHVAALGTAVGFICPDLNKPLGALYWQSSYRTADAAQSSMSGLLPVASCSSGSRMSTPM